MTNPNFGLFWAGDAFLMQGRIMGRQSAGAGFLRAIADQGPTALTCVAYARDSADACRRALIDLGAPDCQVAWVRPWGGEEARLAGVGALFRPDPNLGREAWRRAAGGSHRYSLLGVTHTICSTGVHRMIADFLTAPVEAWDALVCTSQAGRAVVQNILDASFEHLQRRLGAQERTEPQLPVIPLGVHADDFSLRPDNRARARASLELSDDDVVVLYAGRLTPAKANALPMLLALERAARGRRVTLIQAGVFPNPQIEAAYRAEAAAFCPSLRCLFVAGDGPDWGSAWAAADIFTSLADSLQETFGLTPIEAMACGLPVVVSDWNGYKETVRDGVDGFRIPTTTVTPGHTQFVADRYADGLQSIGRYLVDTSSLVAVDIDAAAGAYDQLIGDPELRRRMGEAGRLRAREEFDWRRIYDRYRLLADELGDLRRAAGSVAALPPDPAAQDPLRVFGHYPTAWLDDEVRVVVGAPAPAPLVEHLRATASANSATNLPSPGLIAEILAVVDEHGSASLLELGRALPRRPRVGLEISLIWLLKFGVLAFAPAAQSPAGDGPASFG